MALTGQKVAQGKEGLMSVPPSVTSLTETLQREAHQWENETSSLALHAHSLTHKPWKECWAALLKLSEEPTPQTKYACPE